MSTLLDKGDEDLIPLDSVEQIIHLFRQSEKSAEHRRVGVEHESFVIRQTDGKPVGYNGENGIAALLQYCEHHFETRDVGHSHVSDQGSIIGVAFQQANISLEPGGQFELSGSPKTTVQEAYEEFLMYRNVIEPFIVSHNLEVLFCGFHPHATRSDYEWMPKSRYKIMREYMPRVGHRGLDMMLRTATVQANFDWGSEEECREMVRMSTAISPLVQALFCASPFYEGAKGAFVSERGAVWEDTDPQRSGPVPSMISKTFGYADYVHYALAVPMYFIRRQGHWISMPGITFRTFWEKGYLGHKATIRDIKDHLTTLFPWVRLKNILEVRIADAVPVPFLHSLPALYKGLLYHAPSREKAYQLMSSFSISALQEIQRDVIRHGFQATVGHQSIRAVLEKLLSYAHDGLAAQANGEQERVFLQPLDDLLYTGKTLAEHMRGAYQNEGEWHRIHRLCSMFYKGTATEWLDEINQ